MENSEFTTCINPNPHPGTFKTIIVKTYTVETTLTSPNFSSWSPTGHCPHGYPNTLISQCWDCFSVQGTSYHFSTQ